MTRAYKLGRCPSCGEASTVIYARDREDGTFRKRECSDDECGITFCTLEAVIGGPGRSGNSIPVTLLIELVENLGFAVDLNGITDEDSAPRNWS